MGPLLSVVVVVLSADSASVAASSVAEHAEKRTSWIRMDSVDLPPLSGPG